MPLYEYRCRRCGERFERLVRSAATIATAGTTTTGPAPAVLCPKCASAEVERLISAFARRAPACAPTPSGGG